MDLGVSISRSELVPSNGNLYLFGNNNQDIYKYSCAGSINSCEWTKIAFLETEADLPFISFIPLNLN